MGDIRDRVRADRNWLENLLHSVPGFRGYLGKEERRESDKIQRDFLAGKLATAKRALDELALALVEQQNLEQLGQLDRLRSQIDKVVGRLRHGGYGYSGFFDAVKIREPELDRIYAFDSELLAEVDRVTAALAKLPGLARSSELQAALADAQAQTKVLDGKLDEREQLLRGMR